MAHWQMYETSQLVPDESRSISFKPGLAAATKLDLRSVAGKPSDLARYQQYQQFCVSNTNDNNINSKPQAYSLFDQSPILPTRTSVKTYPHLQDHFQISENNGTLETKTAQKQKIVIQSRDPILQDDIEVSCVCLFLFFIFYFLFFIFYFLFFIFYFLFFIFYLLFFIFYFYF